jgi:hypothetical protein
LPLDRAINARGARRLATVVTGVYGAERDSGGHGMSQRKAEAYTPPRLEAFRVGSQPIEVVPARPEREWMDAFRDRHPYRCLPLLIANAHGWDLLTPFDIEFEWNGGVELGDIVVTAPNPADAPALHAVACSHFGGGILTFHTSHLFRTSPGWSLQASGPANRPKPGLYALTGVIETAWLPFTFTMNWQVLAPGRYRFAKGEPFCTVCPVPTEVIGDVVPEVHALADDPELAAAYDRFRLSRSGFLERLGAGDPEARAQGWQKDYFVGRTPGGERVEGHVNRLRLAAAVDRSGGVPGLSCPARRWGEEAE